METQAAVTIAAVGVAPWRFGRSANAALPVLGP
jgi:hypothetical protein